MPHPGNDFLCAEELFLGENSSCAVYGDFVVLFNEFVVHSWWVLGILSSVSLGLEAAGAAVGAAAAGLDPVEELWMLLLIALCVATSEALRASR